MKPRLILAILAVVVCSFTRPASAQAPVFADPLLDRFIGLMKHLQLIVLLTIGAASTSLAQSEKKVAQSQTSVERQLIELERQLSDALVAD